MGYESKLQSRITKDLERDGWYVVKLSITNKPGIPDLLILGRMKIFFMEIKSKGKKPEPLQLHRHKEINSYGFQVYVIDTWASYLEVRKSFS